MSKREVKPVVELKTYTPNPRQAIIEAAAMCWQATPRQGMLDHLISVGHMSPFKFVHFTFEIAGVSRAFSHQRVRKQVGDDKLQESQRHVIYNDGFDYVVPPSIAKNPDALSLYLREMQHDHEIYLAFLKLRIPAEDARFVLPNGCGTKLRVVSSMLSLIEEAKERLCSCAQWEYQKIVHQQKALVWQVDPILGDLMKPKCKWLGYCPEGERRTCGLMPLKEVVINGG